MPIGPPSPPSPPGAPGLGAIPLLGDLLDFLLSLAPPPTWMDRVRETITMVSPTGQSFEAFWQGGDRSVSKKLGIFDYPNFKGSTIQDLDIKSVTYPLTIYFEGDNHDVIAERFFFACKENGEWTITHPVVGDLRLQLVDVKQKIDPVNQGNITKFDLNFMESLEAGATTSSVLLSVEIREQINLFDLLSLDSFVPSLVTDSFAAIQAVRNTVRGLTSIVRSTLRTTSAALDEIERQINATLDDVIFDPLRLGQQIQELMRIPGQIVTNIESRFSIYDDINTQIYAGELRRGTTPTTTVEDLNASNTSEFILAASSTGLCLAMVDSEADTRPQALSASQSVSDTFLNVAQFNDENAARYVGVPINRRYFAQSATFAQYYRLMYVTAAYLFGLLYDLRRERRFTLQQPYNTIFLCLEQYGTLGEEEEILDLFHASNNISDDEFLVLPAGREIVVYE